MYPRLLLILTGIFFCSFTLAADATVEKSKAIGDKEPSSVITSVRQRVENQLKSLDPDIPIESIRKSPVNGLLTVILKGDHVLYVSDDGNYILRGDMLEIKEGKIANLTTQIRNSSVAEQLTKIAREDMIIFSPKGETKGVVYAFTDLDCGYCRKLHSEITEMNNLGIELRYLAFPRGGNQAPSYHKLVSAWCADDRKAALSALNHGIEIPEKTGKNPIDAQLQLGKNLGVSGTPSLFLEDGRRIPGYRSARDLAKILNIAIEEPKPAAAPVKAAPALVPVPDTLQAPAKPQVAPAA